MRFTAIALVLTLAASATASPALHKRIIGGGPVGKNEIPFIVEFRNKRSPCTGFLISSEIVMTAAHCLRDETHTGLIYGSVEVGKGKSLDFAEFVQHPQYNGSHHDIGLVFLNKKAKATKYAKIQTPPHSYPKPGTKVLAAGYGVIKNGDDNNPPVYPDVLNKVHVEVASKSRCLKSDKTFMGQYEFCASDTPLGRSVCNGDSGGPILIGKGKNQYVIGLVNHGVSGHACGTKGALQYFTYIKAYIPWVKEEYKRFKKEGPRPKP